MTDTDYNDDRLSAEEQERAEKPKRSLWGLFALLCVIVIIILVLLLLRSCSGGGGSNDTGGKTIVPVTGYAPVDGLVSVWISSKGSIDNVLSSAGVDSFDLMDLGGGRYVVTVAKGTEKAAVQRLVEASGVYDAGLVYERPGKK
ncbi:MAG: hypothetical protein FDZ75_04125 [Actinobacteria bacterium]|nr:MAG: hypothetical protein FDZ75_04125 [Actinomycetota bacterium]